MTAAPKADIAYTCRAACCSLFFLGVVSFERHDPQRLDAQHVPTLLCRDVLPLSSALLADDFPQIGNFP